MKRTGCPITGQYCPVIERTSEIRRFGNRTLFENAEIRTSGFRTSTVFIKYKQFQASCNGGCYDIKNRFRKSAPGLPNLWYPLDLPIHTQKNFNSVLYYNSEIWHLQNINPYPKNLVLSTSAKAPKLCTLSYNQEMSFVKLHELNNRATPQQYCIYKHSPTSLNLQQSYTSSQVGLLKF